MLIDYISPEKLPHIVVWLDWHIFANLYSLWYFIALFVILNIHKGQEMNLAWSIFAGVCMWIAYLGLTKGVGVG